MRSVLGFLMIGVGVVCGVYVGVWWAFIGGIVDVIASIRAEELVAMNVAIGIAKSMFAGVIGFGSAVILVIPGVAMLK